MKIEKILFLIAITGLISCGETESINISEARVVVEAFLYADQPISLQISKEILFKREENDTVFHIEGLEIVLNNGVESFQLIEEGKGIYSSENLVDNTNDYSMSFIYNDVEIYSESKVPDKPENYSSSKTNIKIESFTGRRPPITSSESVELNWTNNDSSYYIVVVNNLEDNPPSINDNPKRLNFRSEPIVGNYYEINSLDFSYYGLHSMVLYKVNPEYAALYEDPGDNSLTIKTPYSNIINGLGIFTAMNSDTLYVNVHN